MNHGRNEIIDEKWSGKSRVALGSVYFTERRDFSSSKMKAGRQNDAYVNLGITGKRQEERQSEGFLSELGGTKL